MWTLQTVKESQKRLEALPWKRGVRNEGPVYRRDTWLKGHGGHKGYRVENYFYEKEAAMTLGLPIIPWYRAVVGLWAESDDGIVMKCHNVYEGKETGRPKSYRRMQLTFDVGRPWVCTDRRTGEIVGNYVFNAKEFIAKRAWAYSKPVTWLEQQLKRPSVRNALARYVYLYVQRGGLFTDEDIDLLCSVFFPVRYKAGTIYDKRRFLTWHLSRFSFIRELLNNMIAEAFKKKGLTLDRAVSMLEDAYNKAEIMDDPKTMRDIASQIIGVHEKAWEEERKMSQMELFDPGDDFKDLIQAQPAHHLPQETEDMLEKAAAAIDVNTVNIS